MYYHRNVSCELSLLVYSEYPLVLGFYFFYCFMLLGIRTLSLTLYEVKQLSEHFVLRLLVLNIVALDRHQLSICECRHERHVCERELHPTPPLSLPARLRCICWARPTVPDYL